MANYRAGNVIFVDTDGYSLGGPVAICGIKYIGATTSSITIKSANTSGAALWSDDRDVDIFEDVHIRDNKGIYVALTGTATAYIYLK